MDTDRAKRLYAPLIFVLANTEWTTYKSSRNSAGKASMYAVARQDAVILASQNDSDVSCACMDRDISVVRNAMNIDPYNNPLQREWRAVKLIFQEDKKNYRENGASCQAAIYIVKDYGA